MKIIDGGITAPKGFKSTGGHVGIKNFKKDISMLLSECPTEMAGCFTKNVVKAAPVLWDMQIAASGNKVRGIVVNSGNANACTGEQGIQDNYTLAKTFADCADCQAEEILVCSTGVIGVPLGEEKMNKITNGIRHLFDHLSYGEYNAKLAAEGIMTTDTFVKTVSVEIQLSGKPVRIGGMAKGSGMIHPNMATMLSFVTTDADISREMLDKALKDSVEETYNMISVDGDTSTNDTLLILANGMAANPKIEAESDDYTLFTNALNYINRKLAIDIVRDGEGATKLMEVQVKGTTTKEDAKKLAKSIVSSSLFKAALFGEDANWGRVLCAMGYSGADFAVSDVTILFKSTDEKGQSNEITLMDKGVPIIFDEDAAKNILKEKEILINILLSGGDQTATAWGCDLTYDYVKINGDYRS